MFHQGAGCITALVDEQVGNVLVEHLSESSPVFGFDVDNFIVGRKGDASVFGHFVQVGRKLGKADVLKLA